MSEEESIKRLNHFKTIKVLYGNTFIMFLEQLKKYQQATDVALNLITKQQNRIEKLKNDKKRTIIFIDSQIRCFNRKIQNIIAIKKERCLSERERREIKYLVGKKDECEKIKSRINKFKED